MHIGEYDCILGFQHIRGFQHSMRFIILNLQVEDVAKRNFGGREDFRGQPNRAQVEKKREKKLAPGEKPNWQEVR